MRILLTAATLIAVHALPPAPTTATHAKAPTAVAAADPAAVAVIDTAIAKMGGAEALRGIERARLETMTQWQRTTFDTRPNAVRPTYEWHVELRDYSIPAWRNTRRFPRGGEPMEITDVVNDTVGVRFIGGKWMPLNVAYVDEMHELFTFSPERALLLAREAPDLRLIADTLIDTVPHARISGTVAGFPSVLFIRRTDGLPAMVRYRAAQPNDFGLAPWGEMEVEVWFSVWQKFPGGVYIPMQRDIRRVGRPYKRMTVLAATFNPPATPDSFAIGDSLRAAFFATANRPMHDVPLDSAKIVEGRFATFGVRRTPPGAVKLGDRWMLLEAGVAPLNLERALEWLRRADPTAKVAGAIVTSTTAIPGNGGVIALEEHGLPMIVGTGAAPFVRTILRNHGRPADRLDFLDGGRWLHVDGDSLRIEPVDLPNARGATLVYVPSLRWLYASMAMTPADLDFALAHARRRGWRVDRYGTLLGLVQPVPPTS